MNAIKIKASVVGFGISICFSMVWYLLILPFFLMGWIPPTIARYIQILIINQISYILGGFFAEQILLEKGCYRRRFQINWITNLAYYYLFCAGLYGLMFVDLDALHIKWATVMLLIVFLLSYLGAILARYFYHKNITNRFYSFIRKTTSFLIKYSTISVNTSISSVK
jgi:hypothetical protein